MATPFLHHFVFCSTIPFLHHSVAFYLHKRKLARKKISQEVPTRLAAWRAVISLSFSSAISRISDVRFVCLSLPGSLAMVLVVFTR